MYQHHQGERASGHALAGPVPLYPYSGIGMEMQGIGMDLGEPVALYPYSGIGMDLDGIVDDAKAWLDSLSPAFKALVIAGGIFGAYHLIKNRGKIAGKLGLSKARTNGRRRRKARKNRKVHANGMKATHARMNRRYRARRIRLNRRRR